MLLDNSDNSSRIIKKLVRGPTDCKIGFSRFLKPFNVISKRGFLVSLENSTSKMIGPSEIRFLDCLRGGICRTTFHLKLIDHCVC